MKIDDKLHISPTSHRTKINLTQYRANRGHTITVTPAQALLIADALVDTAEALTR